MENKSKKHYISPSFEIILVDNEISLILSSVPPGGPGEGTDIQEIIEKEEINKSPWE